MHAPTRHLLTVLVAALAVTSCASGDQLDTDVAEGFHLMADGTLMADSADTRGMDHGDASPSAVTEYVALGASGDELVVLGTDGSELTFVVDEVVMTSAADRSAVFAMGAARPELRVVAWDDVDGQDVVVHAHLVA
jgi:hypothetical protein